LNEVIEIIGSALWFILPAYFANATPVVLGGGPPLDGGKKFIDGRRIFGDGKTVRGFVAGLAAGTIIGMIQGIAKGPLSHYLSLGFLLALGALLGDLMGSFIKRRLGIERGGALPGLDQLGFVIIALLLASPVEVPSWQVIVAIFLITPALHLATNFIAYKLGLKSRPY
jgi:CDP-2,3-bis-(O-geranylgeranyl)-sn-glycerol synthase